MELKKTLGQHFLIDQTILLKIIDAVAGLVPLETLIEVGPGMGALTQHIVGLNKQELYLIEKDDRSICLRIT